MVANQCDATTKTIHRDYVAVDSTIRIRAFPPRQVPFCYRGGRYRPMEGMDTLAITHDGTRPPGFTSPNGWNVECLEKTQGRDPRVEGSRGIDRWNNAGRKRSRKRERFEHSIRRNNGESLDSTAIPLYEPKSLRYLLSSSRTACTHLSMESEHSRH